MADTFMDELPILATVDTLVGNVTSGGITQTGLVPRENITNGASPADVAALRARTIASSGYAAGGGDLSADRTITVPKPTLAEALAGTDDTKPISVRQARVARDQQAAAFPLYTPAVRTIWDASRTQVGKIVDTSGALLDNSGYVTNALIPVAPGQSLVCSEIMARVCYRDESGTKVGALVSGTPAGTALTVPAGVYYVDISLTLTGNPNVNTNARLYPLAALPPYRVDFAWTDTETARRLGQTAAVRAIKALSPTQPLNLFNKNAVTPGHALGANGQPYAAAGYNVSPFIPLDPDSTQFILRNGPGANALSYYREADGTTWLSAATVTAATPATPPAEARWVRFQIPDANLATQQMAWGATLPASNLAFGYVTSSYVDTTALTSARTGAAAMRDEAANIMNPADISRDRSISAVNGATSTTAGYATTGHMEVNPGDYIAGSVGTNAVVFFDANKSYLGTISAAAFTAQIAGNVMSVSAIASGTIGVGQRVSGSGVTTSNVLMQLTGTAGGVGTYLMDVSQTVSVDTAMSCPQGLFQANVWVPVPAGAYYARLQNTPISSLVAAAFRQGRSARVQQAIFTADFAGTTMTVTAVASGTGKIIAGDRVIGPGLVPSIITAAPAGGGTGSYTLSVSQATLSGVTAYCGADPAVAAKVYGTAGSTYPNSGKRVLLHGNSQVANGLIQPRLALITGTVLTSAGVPGRSMSGAATDIATRDLSAVDILINEHLVNDYGGNTPLGALTDPDTAATLCGSMLKYLKNAYANKPGIRIVWSGFPYVGPVTTAGWSFTPPGPNAIGVTQKQYNDMARDFAALYGLPFADLFTKSGFNAYTIGLKTSDQLHYNAVGAPDIAGIYGDVVNSL